MKLRPLQDRVLIRRVEGEAKTAGGIFIPDTAQEKPMEGEVVGIVSLGDLALDRDPDSALANISAAPPNV